MDNGSFKEVTIDKDSLYELVDEFNAKPDYKAKKCYLVGVYPLGNNNGEWGSLAKQFTAEILNDAHIHVLFKVNVLKSFFSFVEFYIKFYFKV